MKKLLIVVDMQKDFVTGALGSKEAQEILPNVVKYVQEFNGDLLFTRDTHQANYLTTQEGKFLPVEHCIQGTEGHQICDELTEIVKDRPHKIYDKPTFGLATIADQIENDFGKVEQITLIGVCTDICVISNALLLKSRFSETEVFVVENCCAGVTPQKHDCAIEVMKSCQVVVK